MLSSDDPDNVSFGTVVPCSEGHSSFTPVSEVRILGLWLLEEMVLNWAQASGQLMKLQMVSADNVMMCFMPRNYCHSSCVAKISLAFPYHITFFGVIV